MQAEGLETIQAWVLAVLVYPGLMTGAVLVLAGEWAAALVWPLLRPRIGRQTARHRSVLQPLHHLLKLASRGGVVRWQREVWGPAASHLSGVFDAMCVIAPVLAMALLPFPGSPLVRESGAPFDLITLLGLLAVQPVVRAFVRLREGRLAAWRGAQDIGRLITGLVPTLAVIAALLQVAGGSTLRLTGLLAAPETAQQFFVRVLAGGVLLVALPWWLDWRGRETPTYESAGLFAGRHLQAAALSATWSLLVLPMPGDPLWALAVALGGSLAAYVALRVLAVRWMPARREKDAANWVWATTLPAAALALVLAYWVGV